MRAAETAEASGSNAWRARTVEVPDWPRAKLIVLDLPGPRDGPLVSIVAGSGGTAYPGIEACWRLIDRLRGEKLRGRLRLIPSLDVAGFLDRSAHFCPLDDRALLSAFDEAALGASSNPERATDAVVRTVREALDSPDMHIDLRGGEIHETDARWIATVRPDRESTAFDLMRVANASGADMRLELGEGEPPPVNLGSAGLMARTGIPALILSAGGIDPELDRGAEKLLDSLLRILRSIDVLEADDAPPAKAPLNAGPRWWTHLAGHSGLWVPDLSAGARVTSGQRLGQVWDWFGTVLEEVRAPFDGCVIKLTTSMAVDATPRPDSDTWFARTLTMVSAR